LKGVARRFVVFQVVGKAHNPFRDDFVPAVHLYAMVVPVFRALEMLGGGTHDSSAASRVHRTFVVEATVPYSPWVKSYPEMKLRLETDFLEAYRRLSPTKVPASFAVREALVPGTNVPASMHMHDTVGRMMTRWFADEGICKNVWSFFPMITGSNVVGVRTEGFLQRPDTISFHGVRLEVDPGEFAGAFAHEHAAPALVSEAHDLGGIKTAIQRSIGLSVDGEGWTRVKSKCDRPRLRRADEVFRIYCKWSSILSDDGSIDSSGVDELCGLLRGVACLESLEIVDDVGGQFRVDTFTR